ncbi:hypothetical protein [Aquimarina algiphila]|uniref:Lipoprotein n=1 Tax=Aquimarina algiphila TaxID=2047982 RepID=A0A554VBW9_9FLAO|nr:hypothetical protein [Aquimarina algiphila]TSE04094.1 hypothetical protein FOF46_27505 [Aquimarina algiphila]
MKNFYKLIFASYILLFMYGCASYAPKDNKLSIVLSKTQKAITGLAEKTTVTNDDNLIKAFSKLEKKSIELFPALEVCNKKYALTPEYMATLQEAQKTLERLHKDFNTISNKTFLLDAIYLDYDAKLASITSSAKNDANTKIKVIVDSNEEEGYFVFGKLSYEKELNIKRFRFNKPTHNASQDFVPGYYLFWLEKEDRIGEPELHLIMSDGTEEEKKLVLKTPK